MKKTAALIVLAAAATANADVFGPGAGFSIPDSNPAGASSTVNVSGMGNITGMTVTINGLSHTWVGDLVVTLTSPGGTNFLLMSRVGSTTATGLGDSSNLGGDYTFDDAASQSIWDIAVIAANGTGFVIPTGTYRTTGAQSSAYTSIMGAFGGSDPNGVWTLAITDNAGGDTGAITGWSLNIVPTPSAAAALGLGGLALGRRRRA